MSKIETHQLAEGHLFLAPGRQVSGDPRVEEQVMLGSLSRKVYSEAGRLIAIGGAATVDNYRVVARHLKDRKPPVIITTPTSIPEKRFADTLEAFSFVDITGAFHLGAHTLPEEGNAMLQLGGGAFITGGDQIRGKKVLEEIEMDASLKSFFKDGYPIAGTSAGAAMQPKTMSYGDSIKEGMGLADGINIVTHEWEMERDWRDKMMVDVTHTVSLGLPEATGVIYQRNGDIETFGSNKVNLVWQVERQKGNRRVPSGQRVNIHELSSTYEFATIAA